MDIDLLARSYDLAMLQTAALFDLSSKAGLKRSHAWLAALFQEMTRACEPEVVLELGAFQAEFSVAARAQLPRAEIHAFEANPYNIARYGKRLRRGGVDYHHLAVGDAVGMATFNVVRREAGQEADPVRGNNSLRTKPVDAEYEAVEVPMVTIDHFLGERGLAGRPVVMWIDLEGCAFEALTGAAAALAHTRLIFIEVEDTPLWTGQKLSGEVMRHLVGAGFMPLARDFQSKRQYNLIFGRPEILDRAPVRQALIAAFAEAGRLVRAGGGEMAAAATDR